MTVLWDAQNFTAPTLDANGNGILATSATISNNADQPVFVLDVTYASPNPDAATGTATYKVFATIEAEDDAGNWVQVAVQNRGFNDSNDGTQHRIMISPSNNTDPGQSYLNEAGGLRTYTDYYPDYADENMRVVLRISDPNQDFVSLTVSATARLKNG